MSYTLYLILCRELAANESGFLIRVIKYLDLSMLLLYLKLLLLIVPLF